MNYLRIIVDFVCIPFSRRVDVEDDPDIQREGAWYATEFKPKPSSEADYEIALKYAEEYYKEVKESYAALEKKAEWFFPLAIAAISVVYLMSPEKTFGSLFTWGIPSVIFSILAFLSLLRVKIPGVRPTGMPIRGAIECVESSVDARAIISANLHCATQKLAKVIEWKAKQITFASFALVGAFTFAPLVLFAPHAPAVTSAVVVDIPLAKPRSSAAATQVPPVGSREALQLRVSLPASLELRGRLELKTEESR
jgi:hypothetical protein